MIATVIQPAEDSQDPPLSLADLFLQNSRELARSDARIYRSISRHLARTREILNREEVRHDGTIPVPAPRQRQILLGAPSFERQTRRSLANLCQQHGIRGYSRMNKPTMILRLREAGIQEPPIPMEALSKEELLTLLRELLNTPAQDG